LTGLLVSREFAVDFAAELRAIERLGGAGYQPILLPDGAEARVAPGDVARIEIAFFSAELFPARGRAFFAACQAAPKLRWMHFGFTGTDHPIFDRFRERGITLTNSPGVSAEPIAQTAFAGLLMLARGFPRWLDAQRRRAWERLPTAPRDLQEDTLLVLGAGSIGSALARFAKAVPMHVIGVRRGPPRPGEPFDELYPPARLPELLPRAQWLAITAPLTRETRGLIDAAALRALPRGARLLNVGRGEIVDEQALCDSLRSGWLAGAYLDVFAVEPLAAESPLWALANVLITPHNSAASAGARARQARIFLENLDRHARGEPLLHVVKPEG
jgi:phosphoglycerate dehydrogenase-like enzyme